MKNKKERRDLKKTKAVIGILFITIVAVSLLTGRINSIALASHTEDSTLQEKIQDQKRTIAEIKVSFKVDPRVTRGMYMGDRWISPPKYLRVGESKECTVETRVLAVDVTGKPMKIKPDWIAANPAMVTVNPVKGDEVYITVKVAGESKLKITAEGVSKELTIKGKESGNVLQVEIIQ